MQLSTIPISNWVRFTIITGLTTIVSYGLAAFVPLPELIGLMFAFAFGPLFMLSSVGLFKIIRQWRNSISLQVAVLFNIVGSALVTLMLVVQQTLFAFHDKFKAENRGTVSDEQLTWIFKEVNSIQLGIDMAWDIFISAGTFFFALAMWRHPVFGKVFSIIGIIASILLLIFNMAYFPVPPGEAGSIDFGPLVALWYLALTIWILMKRKRFFQTFTQQI
ncbi:MAG TPA: DUF4386 family protein [Chitinophagaceae bacterium]|nr:DUF4386 family protein [Chitinophagaceae bacterium]